MKYFLRFTLFMAAFFIFVGNTYALSISFDITSDYLTGDDNITFDFFGTTDTDVQVKGYKFDFKYDQNELNFVSYENLGQSVFSSGYSIVTPAGGVTNDNINGFLNGFFTRAGRGVPLETLEAGTTKLGSFTFSLAENTILDGLSDFNMHAVTYMNIYENGIKIASTNDLGPVNIDGSLNYMKDVGSAVPAPAAILLLGSGLLGLIGLRRKTAK